SRTGRCGWITSFLRSHRPSLEGQIPSWCTGCPLFRSLDAPFCASGLPASAASLAEIDARRLLENCIASTSIFVLPSYKEPTVDALASTTDERRGWLRKATGSCRPSIDPWMSEWGNPALVMEC